MRLPFTLLFERLGISTETWRRFSGNFGRWFRVVAGKPNSAAIHSSHSGCHGYRMRRADQDAVSIKMFESAAQLR